MDLELLISEVEKRPALWNQRDPKYTSREYTAMCWTEVAEIMQSEVYVVKKKWKNLRDIFRLEMKRVPPGKSDDLALPMNQYQSKWAYFKKMFFLRDLMVGRKVCNFNADRCGSATAEIIKEKPTVNEMDDSLPSFLQNEMEVSDNQTVESFSQGSDAAELKSPQIVVFKRKRHFDLTEKGSEDFSATERARLETQKQLSCLHDQEKKEKEDSDADRHFLLSLLPLLIKVPETEKTIVKIKIQKLLHETVFGTSIDSAI